MRRWTSQVVVDFWLCWFQSSLSVWRTFQGIYFRRIPGTPWTGIYCRDQGRDIRISRTQCLCCQCRNQIEDTRKWRMDMQYRGKFWYLHREHTFLITSCWTCLCKWKLRNLHERSPWLMTTEEFEIGEHKWCALSMNEANNAISVAQDYRDSSIRTQTR